MRKISFLLLGVLLCCLLSGCAEKRAGFIPIGKQADLSNGNYLTVLESYAENGKIVVKLKTEFQEIRLADCTRIAIGVPYTPKSAARDVGVDKDETNKYNEYDVFDTVLTNSEVLLVFSDSEFEAGMDLSQYSFYIEHPDLTFVQMDKSGQIIGFTFREL